MLSPISSTLRAPGFSGSVALPQRGGADDAEARAKQARDSTRRNMGMGASFDPKTEMVGNTTLTRQSVGCFELQRQGPGEAETG